MKGTKFTLFSLAFISSSAFAGCPGTWLGHQLLQSQRGFEDLCFYSGDISAKECQVKGAKLIFNSDRAHQCWSMNDAGKEFYYIDIKRSCISSWMGHPLKEGKYTGDGNLHCSYRGEVSRSECLKAEGAASKRYCTYVLPYLSTKTWMSIEIE